LNIVHAEIVKPAQAAPAATKLHDISVREFRLMAGYRQPGLDDVVGGVVRGLFPSQPASPPTTGSTPGFQHAWKLPVALPAAR
jgi:hypothetical protein